MNSPLPLVPSRVLWRLALVILLPIGTLRATETEEPVAVFAQVFNGYARTRLPDKSFKPEAYTFGEGGCWSQPVRDGAKKEMTFLRVAQAVATPLAHLNYRPAKSVAEAELLILVFWGATQGSRGQDQADSMDRFSTASAGNTAAKSADLASNTDSTKPDSATAAAEFAYDNALWQMSVENEAKDKLDSRNARILGYDDALDRARSAAHMSFAKDIIAEVGDNRYYVVLQAYDFKTAAKEKKLKPLWTARISMSEGRNNFADSLDQMLRNGAHYFGQDSNGLHRDVTRDGRVDIGPTKVIEPEPAK